MGLKVFNINCCIFYLYSKVANFIIWGKFKIVPLKSQSPNLHPHKHEINLSPKCSQKTDSSFLFLGEFAYIISEENFYIYRKRERGKESSSFLSHSPKRLDEMGTQSRTQPTVYGMGRDAERCRDWTLAWLEIMMQVPTQGGSIPPCRSSIYPSQCNVLPTAAISSSAKRFHEKRAAF